MESNDNKQQAEESIQDILEQEVPKKPEAEIGFVQRLIKIFVSPTEVFEDIGKKPMIVPALLLIAVLAVVILVPQMGAMRVQMQEQINMQFQAQGQQITADQMEAAMGMGITFGVIFGAIALVLAPVVKALFAHGISSIMDGKGKMSQSFGVVLYSTMIVMGGQFIRMIMVLITNDAAISFSPGIFVSVTDSPVLFSLLTQLDLFVLWYLAVSVIGFKAIHKFSTGKAVTAVLVPWLIAVAFAVVPLMMVG